MDSDGSRVLAVKRLLSKIKAVRNNPNYIDSEWKILYKWSADIRMSHHITIAEFLLLCGLEHEEIAFTPYLSKYGLKRRPSKAPNTIGYDLREKIQKAKQDEELGKRLIIPVVSFEIKVRGICIEFIYEKISNVTVCGIIFEKINEDDSSIVVSANFCIEVNIEVDGPRDDKDSFKEKLTQYIWEKLQLQINITVTKFTCLIPLIGL
mmetsp:Transcript_22966/g.32967  ORF Transcript_22966/g.32967 Transcript_22966/m.32967 type:complete len:207 (+) Transcript_22966:842-1462(+)